jgi:hypothetical protein
LATKIEVGEWRNEGIWLLPPLLLLAALVLRDGVGCEALGSRAIAAALLLGASLQRRGTRSRLGGLWQRPDQRAEQLLESGQAAAAAPLFQDPRQRANAEMQGEGLRRRCQTIAGRSKTRSPPITAATRWPARGT